MIYLFEHPTTGELRDVCFEVNDDKTYIDENGILWQRRWTPPQISMDTKVDPYSQKQFLNKTRNAGTVGDLMDRAADLSAMRADKDGVDLVKKNYEDQEAKLRGGKRVAKKLKDIEIEVKVK